MSKRWFWLFLLALCAAVATSGCASRGLSSSDRAFIAGLSEQPKKVPELQSEEEQKVPELRSVGGRMVNIIVVHHTAGSQSDDAERIIPAISRLHSRRLNAMSASLGLTVAYHYIIMSDGAVHQTRNEGDIGHHAGNWEVNKTSIGICLTGNFEKHKPTREQIQSLDRLVRRLQQERNIVKIIPHSHCRATLCCGKYLEAEIRKLPWGEHF